MPRGKPGVRACLASVISSRLAIMNSKRALIVSALVLLFALSRLFANGGAWQTGVPVTGNAAATDEKKTTNVTIEDEKLTIDLHQEFAVVEVRYRMKNTGGQVDQDFFFPGRERTVSVANNIGAMRLKARVEIDGHVRETPALEIRRFAGNGFRAAITEQFELPYLFGSGELNDGNNTGPETGFGADCANFAVYALRRQRRALPWSNPKQLRKYLEPVAENVRAGETAIRENL